MITAIRLMAFSAIVFSAQMLFAQSKMAQSNLSVLEQNEWKKDISHYKTHIDFIKAEKENLGLAEIEDLQFNKVIETKGNWKHTKYQQFYKGIPVLNGVYILHEKEGALKKASGNILPNIRVNTTPNFDEKEAVNLAKLDALDDAIKENKGKLPEGLAFNSIHNTTPELYIADKQYPRNSGEYGLAYVFELEFHSYPPRHDQYIFDAHTGQIIDVIPQVCSFEVEGKVKTRYYGEQTVMVDSIAPDEFLLQDFTRGDGIITINDYTDAPFVSDSKTFDLANDFDDDAAADAHWAASRYYDWLRDSFGFNSIDNQGHELRSVIHLNEGEAVVNAFWNGRFATFGDGDCTGYGPLTSIDVVSHEFTHGLTRNNSGLVYRYESGGLNESMSDMFGKGLEYYHNPSGFTWEIAHDFRRDSTVDVFRNMSDPNLENHPKYYKGRFWSARGEGVHTNSNVMNYWFYLLVEGGSGTNERDYNFAVQKLGMDKTIQMVFIVNTAYLVPNSDYQHAYESTLEVAEDLWGIDSWEYVAVEEAWRAVGLSSTENFTADKDIAIHLLNKDTVICGADATREINVEIENLSNADLPAGTEVELGFRLNSDAGASLSNRQFQTFTLADDLPMGERLALTFDNELTLTNTTGNRERIEVFVGDAFGDQNSINNIDFREIFVTRFDKPDAALQISRIGNEICDPNLLTLSIQIRNEGCQSIPAGTDIKVDLEIGQVDTSIVLSLQNDLAQNNRRTEQFEIPISTVETGELQFSGVHDFVDENSANNEAGGDALLFQKAPNDISEDFEVFSLDINPNLHLDRGSKTLFRPVEYLGEKMLGISALSAGGASISRDCDNFRKVLQEHEGFDSKIQFCVDLEGLDNPTLSFDLVQFTTENTFNIPKEYSSVFTVSTTDDDFEPIVIMDQNVGEIVTYDIPLPFGFEGQITLNSFTLFGNIIKFAQGDYDELNAHLIDNLRISNGPTNTSEISDNELIRVYPNPAKDVVWFENKSSDFDKLNIEIFNSLGAKIHEIDAASHKIEWQSAGQPTGVYFYKISSNGDWIDSGRLVLE